MYSSSHVLTRAEVYKVAVNVRVLLGLSLLALLSLILGLISGSPT